MSVVAVHVSPTHQFSKQSQSSITLVANHGVQGDCHAGPTVQHRSRLHIRPAPPNLRQVHLFPAELLAELREVNEQGTSFDVSPGQLGENITTVGIDLLGLSRDTRLHFVMEQVVLGAPGVVVELGTEHPVVKVTGLRNPCPQIDSFTKGLKERCIVRDERGAIIARRAGVMGIVETGGEVGVGSRIVIEEPLVQQPLECV